MKYFKESAQTILAFLCCFSSIPFCLSHVHPLLPTSSWASFLLRALPEQNILWLDWMAGLHSSVLIFSVVVWSFFVCLGYLVFLFCFCCCCLFVYLLLFWFISVVVFCLLFFFLTCEFDHSFSFTV